MAAAWGSVSTGSVVAAPSTGLTITKPADVATGDVLYAFISKTTYADTNDFTCTDWTLVGPAAGKGTTTGNDRHINILRKVITDGGSEPADYTFVTTSGTASGMAGLIVRVTGADTTTPEDVTLTSSHRVFASDDATPASVDMTTVTDGALVLQYCMLALASTATKTWGAPDGYTQDPSAVVTETTSASSDQQCGVAYKTQAVAGAVGANVWTHTADDATTETVCAVIAVRPAAGGTSAPAAEATGVGAANTATTTVASEPGSAAVTGTAPTPNLAVALPATESATVGAAYDATIATVVAAPATVAAGTGTAETVTEAIAAASESASGAGAGNTATSAVAASAEPAESTAETEGAHGVSPSAGEPAGVGAAYDASTTVVVQVATSANSVGTASRAAVSAAVNAATATAVGSASNASVLSAVPDPNARTITIHDHGHTISLKLRK